MPCRIAWPPKSYPKTPNAASPSCAANSASSSTRPWSRTPPEPIRAIPTPSRQLVKHVSEGDTVKLKSTGRAARVARKIDDNHFEVEMGVMKMKIARADIAEVLTSARPAETPVTAARARGISVSLAERGRERAQRDQRNRPHG